MLPAYRAAGATLPFGDPRGYHGAGMEGHYWRFTHAASGRVVIVILAISRDRAGRAWSMVSLADPSRGARRLGDRRRRAGAAARGLGVAAGGRPARDRERGSSWSSTAPPWTSASTTAARWPRRAFGVLGPAGAVPGLSQYWHP